VGAAAEIPSGSRQVGAAQLPAATAAGFGGGKEGIKVGSGGRIHASIAAEEKGKFAGAGAVGYCGAATRVMSAARRRQ